MAVFNSGFPMNYGYYQQPMMQQSVFYPNMMIAPMQPQQPMRKVRRHDDDYTFDGSLPKEFHQTHQNISNVWK